MAGTVVFQVGSLATPGPGIVVGQDDVNGTAWQYVKLDVGPAGTTRPVSYASGTGLPVSGLGTFQALGTFQQFGTNQALGTFQPHGTAQALGTFQPLAGSVHVASTGTLPIGTVQVLGSVQTVGTSQVLGSVQAVGTTLTKEICSTASTTTSVAATVGNIILIAANPNRLGAAVYLEGGSALFLKLGSLAGTVDYTLQMVGSSYYEVPYNYMGTISGIWAFTGGTARITEVS